MLLACLEQRFVDNVYTSRGLYVFKHDSELGNAPAHRLFERITPNLKPGVAAPRAFSDYDIIVRDTGLPAGVTLMQRV